MNPLAPVWRDLGGYYALVAHAFARLRVLRIAPVRLVFLRQVYYTGIEAFGTISLIALLTGALAITQIITLMGANAELVLRVLVWVVVRELGPLFAAILIIARSSPAIAAELALMKTHREIDYLNGMGIATNDYLVVPRVAGVTISVIVLTFYFQVVAILGGIGVSALIRHVSFVELLGDFMEVVSLAEIGGTVVKSFLFGLVIAVISCFHGLAVGHEITDVPKAAIKAVMRSLMAVFAIDAVLAYLSFAF